MKRATILKAALALAVAAVLWNTLDVESYKKKPKNRKNKNKKNKKPKNNKNKKWWSWKPKKPKKPKKQPKKAKPMSWASYNTKYAPIRAQEAQQLPAAIAAFATPSPAIAALAAPSPVPSTPVAGLISNNPNNVIEGPIPGGNYNVYAPPDASNNAYYNNAMAYFRSDPDPVQDTSQMTIIPDGGGPASYAPRPLQDEFGRTYYSGGY